MRTIFIIFCLFFVLITELLPQKEFSKINLVNSIFYNDTSFTDLPGNCFLIDIGDEVLAVTCKHTLWTNKTFEMNKICLTGKLKVWKMVDPNDSSQYIILGDLINSDSNEIIGEQNLEEDFLVFKIKENHSMIVPLKLSTKLLQSGDTVYKQGWTFKLKNQLPRSYAAKVIQYYGASLLIDNFENFNGAGLSGSPVLNSNNELVGIVSSWKYHLPDSSWHEAVCSTDYLWIVLYKYWIKKNNLTQNIESFKLFLDNYKTNNNAIPEISEYMFTKLFFENEQIKNLDNYKKWIKNVNKKYESDFKITNYHKSVLIFEEWGKKYIQNKSTIKDLTTEIIKERVDMPEMLVFCKFSQELIKINKPDQAIEILLYADKIYQHMGQLYAFLGDCYLAKDDKTKAMEYYQKCLNTYPEYPMAVWGLAKSNY